MVLPRLIEHNKTSGKKGAIIHVLGDTSQKEEISFKSPERPSPMQHIYSSWMRSYNFTYGLGITEQFRENVDVLTAIKPEVIRKK